MFVVYHQNGGDAKNNSQGDVGRKIKAGTVAQLVGRRETSIGQIVFISDRTEHVHSHQGFENYMGSLLTGRINDQLGTEEESSKSGLHMAKDKSHLARTRP